jgi:hypothetical protein
VDFPFENPTGYKKPTVRSEEVEKKLDPFPRIRFVNTLSRRQVSLH